MKTPCITLGLLLSALFFAAELWAKPLVVTTIRPLTMLVEAIAGDSVEIRQLLPDSEIPHHYSLRVTDQILLNQADLLLWVGPNLEVFLSKNVANLRPEKVITAEALPDIQWSKAVISQHDDEHKGKYEVANRPDHHPGDSAKNSHIWMNPANGQVIARELSNWLAAHYPGQQDQFLSAQKHFAEQLTTAVNATRTQLQALKTRKFIVDHDAFGHFATAFDLEQSGALKTGTGLSASAREFHKLLSQTDVNCIIAEPRHNHERIAKIASTLNAKTVTIDPLGANIALDDAAYIELIKSTGETLASCLSPLQENSAHSESAH